MSDEQYGIGFQLLAKMGYQLGQGLGKNNQGIKECIDVLNESKRNNTGIGQKTKLRQPNQIETIILSDDEDDGITQQEIKNIEESLLNMGVKPSIIDTLKKQGSNKVKQFHDSRIKKRQQK